MKLTFLIQRKRHRDLDKIRRQRILSQMKEQDKATARDLSQTDISNMPDREFKSLIIRILIGLEKKEWRTSVRHLIQR